MAKNTKQTSIHFHGLMTFGIIGPEIILGSRIDWVWDYCNEFAESPPGLRLRNTGFWSWPIYNAISRKKKKKNCDRFVSERFREQICWKIGGEEKLWVWIGRKWTTIGRGSCGPKAETRFRYLKAFYSAPAEVANCVHALLPYTHTHTPMHTTSF